LIASRGGPATAKPFASKDRIARWNKEEGAAVYLACFARCGMALMRSRLLPALVAGSVAIIINTLALKAADLVPLATAKGGLLRLLASWFAPLLGWIGIASAWSQLGLPGVASPVFQTGFHLAVGLLMALFYAYLVEPLLPMRDVLKGAIYALAVWLLNAFAVLPATGEGIAGIAHLTLAGIVWYAAAHSLFFVPLALFYGALTRAPRNPSVPLNGAR